MKYRILMIENDSDDRFLAEDVFLAEGLDAKIDFVYSADAHTYISNTQPRPDLILLDRNTQPHEFTDMIQHIRQAEGYAPVPIVVISNTNRREDIERSYACGANSFIKKPDDYAGSVSTIKSFINYWFQAVELPVAQAATPFI